MFKKLIVLCLSIALSLTGLVGNVKADKIESGGQGQLLTPVFENVITPQSGGYVKTEYELVSCSLYSTYSRIEYLTTAWAKASSYQVTQQVSVGSTSEISQRLITEVFEDFNYEIQSNYGTTVSTTTSIGTILPADASIPSKLRFRVTMKKYFVQVKLIDTYFDTATGYTTYESMASGYITFPLNNTEVIEVYYQY